MDEPFYAFYLKKTGADHPGAEEVIAAGETDWRKIVANLTGLIPNGRRHFLSKANDPSFSPRSLARLAVRRDQLLPHSRRGRGDFASYIKKNREPTVEDVGFVQQAEIFDFVRSQTGSVPPVIDAGDVLRVIPGECSQLSCAMRVRFSSSPMRCCSWAPEPRQTDGVWAKYWYAEVGTLNRVRTVSRKKNRIAEKPCGGPQPLP